MGLHADSVFAMDLTTIDSTTAWIGILAYTFQIYFDFSGYSDMAIGIAKMVGFKFPENFNNPYISSSITEFWRRWHITLGAWMRNYLYIPLGGNKVSKGRLYFNLWLVFLASGLWHGASWCFIIWGAYHGMFLVLERIFLLDFYAKTGKFLSTIITFFVVVIGWVFFRIELISDAFLYLKRMFIFDFSGLESYSSEFLFFLTVSILFSFFAYFQLGQKIQDSVYFKPYTVRRHVGTTLLTLVLFILSISSITSFGFNPFIYFRF